LAGNMITPNALEIKQVGNNLQAYLTFNDNNITNTFKIFSKQYPFKLVMSYSDADKSVVYDIIEVKHKVMKIRLPEIGDKNWNLVGYKYGYNLWEKKFSQQVITDQTIKFIAFNEFNDSDFRKRELSIITNSGAFVSILTGDNSLNQVIKNVVVGNSGNYDWHIPNTLVGDWVKITAQKVGFYEKSIFIWIIEDKIQDAEGNVIKQNQLDLSLIEKS
ncbi:MAG: hypothetical protein KAH84_08540, partial [Thiomargarita sp.]|nr:hypothetical protein [Thiomargarita sp.]